MRSGFAVAVDAKPSIDSRGFPQALCMRQVDPHSPLVMVSFSLGQLQLLSPAQLAVARLATAGMSNAAIAHLRGTAVRTVARQMACVLNRLAIGSRLGLATIPELGA